MRDLVILLLCFTFTAQPAEAQQYHYKDPVVASILGGTVIGAGHLYARDYTMGISLAVVGYGPAALAAVTGDDTLRAAAIGAAGITWLLSWFDAWAAAVVYNRQHNLALAPAHGRPGLALRVGL